MKKPVAAVAVAALLAGCANMQTGANWSPVVDIRPEQSNYDTDLAQCQQYATRVMNAQTGAIAGGIAGALLGAALGAVAGGNSQFNGRMAGVGAIAGGVGGAGEAEGDQRGIIRRCLAGRGYNVLN